MLTHDIMCDHMFYRPFSTQNSYTENMENFLKLQENYRKMVFKDL